MPLSGAGALLPRLTGDITGSSRNRLCDCGSGRRLKHCCGIGPASAARDRALQLHREWAFGNALLVYDQALRIDPEDWDVAHMRATALYQAGLTERAIAAFAALLDSPARALPGFMTNLGLALAARGTPWRAPARVARAAADRSTEAVPTISVVMPVYNHAPYVAAAMRSVFEQTQQADELIIIDDGSTDDSVAVVRATLAEATCPTRFIARENRGAHATLNEAVGLARGRWIQPLNSDDLFTPGRLAMVARAIMTSPEIEWGFARAECMDTGGATIDERRVGKSAEVYRVQDAISSWPSAGLALLTGNASVSTGNLFFRRTLFDELGGFAALRYNHDWDFCLRASLCSEPMTMPETLYRYRLHSGNTISESATAAQRECDEMMAQWLRETESGRTWRNPLAPSTARWGAAFAELLGAVNLLHALPVDQLRACLAPPHLSARHQTAQPGDHLTARII